MFCKILFVIQEIIHDKYNFLNKINIKFKKILFCEVPNYSFGLKFLKFLKLKKKLNLLQENKNIPRANFQMQPENTNET